MKKILTIIGTRPEAIKTVILHKLLMNNDLFEPYLLSTGQHGKLVDEVLSIFDVTTDISLDIPEDRDSLATKTSFIIKELEKEINILLPDFVVVQGDTLSSFCGALVAYFKKIPVIHLEAGLRSFNKYGPFPEEIFRQCNDLIGDYLFAPTSTSADNLRREGVPDSRIVVTGNTGIDALNYVVDRIRLGELKTSELVKALINSDAMTIKKRVLITIHRRESHDNFITHYLKPIDTVAQSLEAEFYLAVHPNPVLQQKLDQAELKAIRILPALNYVDFVSMMQSSDLILTDSGGIQEEAVSLGVPLIILREETERPEAVKDNLNKLFNANQLDTQIKEAFKAGKREPSDIYGDGKASEKICEILSTI